MSMLSGGFGEALIHIDRLHNLGSPAVILDGHGSRPRIIDQATNSIPSLFRQYALRSPRRIALK
jgi:hypothetical protein